MVKCERNIYDIEGGLPTYYCVRYKSSMIDSDGNVIATTSPDYDLFVDFLEACRNGVFDDVKMYLNKNHLTINNINEGLQQACLRGYMAIVKLLIDNGANDFNSGMNAACEGGNEDIVNLMLELGADNYDTAMAYACSSGNLDIVKQMIGHGAKSFRLGIRMAYEENYDNVADFLFNYIETHVVIPCAHCGSLSNYDI
jgi:ankyrin repeat protein